MNTEQNLDSSLSKDCKKFRAQLPDLLLEDGYAASHPEVAAHTAGCIPCREELAAFRSTFALLDDYQAPEPSPFFDTRLHARLREVQAAGPETLWERMKSYLQFSTGRSFRPALAGALAVVMLLAGGGTFIGLHNPDHRTPQASSAVNDLKVLDNNEQAEQQMGQLLDQTGAEDGDEPTT